MSTQRIEATRIFAFCSLFRAVRAVRAVVQFRAVRACNLPAEVVFWLRG